MPDLSKFNQENLFRELQGRRLENFFSDYAFNKVEDYEAQTPSIYPLGQLHYGGTDGGRGSGQRWLSEDEAIFVDVDHSGTILWVTEAY